MKNYLISIATISKNIFSVLIIIHFYHFSSENTTEIQAKIQKLKIFFFTYEICLPVSKNCGFVHQI